MNPPKQQEILNQAAMNRSMGMGMNFNLNSMKAMAMNNMNPAAAKMNTEAQLQQMMACESMKRQSMQQQLNQQLSLNTLGFAGQPSGSMTLADVLGKIDQTVFPQTAHQAEDLGQNLEGMMSLPPLPIESKFAMNQQQQPELHQSMDEVIGLFGRPNNSNSHGDQPQQQQQQHLEPLLMFPGEAKRAAEHSEDRPASKKQKKSLLNDDETNNCFRAYQAEAWTQRFEELCDYARENGHCQVPHTFSNNPSLARWVKRQRYQYKLRLENKPSTMTDERISVLQKVGFIWDSHEAAWDERRMQLVAYRRTYGHCNVPITYFEHSQLAVWVKRQRRQYKFFWDGKPSSMSNERIAALEAIGFEWELRVRESKKKK